MVARSYEGFSIICGWFFARGVSRNHILHSNNCPKARIFLGTLWVRTGGEC